MKRRALFPWFLIFAVTVPFPMLAQDEEDEDEDFRPGLIATVIEGQSSTSAVVAEPVLVAGPQTSPSAPLRGRYTGTFLSRGEGAHQFHAHLTGRVTVRLGDRTVLETRTDANGWISGPTVDLQFGEFPLEIQAELTAPGSALKLYWSSEAFPLEPLPYHALFHEDDSREIRRAALGRDFVAAWQCGGCHQGLERDASLAGPSLLSLSAGTDAHWLRERLTRTEPPADGRMPAFGFSEDDADAILAYLTKAATPPKLTSANIKTTEKDVIAGSQLIKSVGCLACHGWQELGKNPLFGGGSLDEVTKHRSTDWIETKLREPQRVNPHSRMPTFSLSDTERRQIIAALLDKDQNRKPSITSTAKAIKATDALVTRGRELVRAARCAACHDLPKEVGDYSQLSAVTAENAVSDRSCLGNPVDAGKHRPAYAAKGEAAVIASLTARAQSPATTAPTPDQIGERLLTTKGCVQCHDRNGSKGLAAITKEIVATEADWNGQAPTLQPPPLTAVGDRLPDAGLDKGVRGELPRRMDWLRVRMPKFRHTDDEARLLATSLIAHDRIPDAAPATPEYPVAHGKVDPQVMLAGRELTGGKGFSCVACHQLKDYVPPKVALGTRGSDLYRLGDRMRAPYFFRWTRSPLRILPGVEMPSYQRPHPTILGGDLKQQLAAIWDALHDPQFTAPTNPAVVEQLWGPSDSGRLRIIRDMFTVKNADGKTVTVPRTFAVGFANRHNVLFDLHAGQVRVWTIGDFARQRTQGKSWFWDLAGVPVATDFPEAPDLFLVADQTGEVIAPESGWVAHLEFQESQIEPDHAVTFRYRLAWSREQQAAKLTAEIQERWSQSDHGWQRTVTAESLPKGYDIWLRRPKPGQSLGTPELEPVNDGWLLAPTRGIIGVQLIPQATLAYRSSIDPPAVTANPPLPEQIPVQPVTCFPGFTGERLPLTRAIMPTALTWDADGQLVFTSLKGHVYRVQRSSQSAGVPDQLSLIAEGLAAPYGIYAIGRQLLVSHKPEVLLLDDVDGDGFAEREQVVATGWGYSDDYHDWTCGIVRDSTGKFYVSLGSDYTHKNRPASESRWRGNMLRFDLDGHVEPIATGLRYATGLAMLPGDQLFCTDQQGVQNCFNELNHIQPGKKYGVPAKLDPQDETSAEPAAVQVPHPWTRSVNGITVWPDNGHPFAGQIVGAEYNERMLIRASIEEVDGVLQGATYPLSSKGQTNGPEELTGPLSVAFSPDGELYVGSIQDSGWIGGLNTGDIVRFRPTSDLPNGIREVRATPRGFRLEFLRPIDAVKAKELSQYKLSGYTRIWEGNYATPDSGRHVPTLKQIEIQQDDNVVELVLDGLKPGFVYDIAVGAIGSNEALWPAIAYYTLHRQPKSGQ